MTWSAFLQGLMRLFWRLAAFLVIGTALLLVAVRLALAWTDYWGDELADYVGEQLQAEVTIGGLEAGLRGLRPQFVFRDVTVARGENAPLKVEHLAVDLRLVSSLRELAPVIDAIVVQGGEWTMGGLQEEVELAEVLTTEPVDVWPYLEHLDGVRGVVRVREFDLYARMPDADPGDERPLGTVDLDLVRQGEVLHLSGAARLVDERGTLEVTGRQGPDRAIRLVGEMAYRAADGTRAGGALWADGAPDRRWAVDAVVSSRHRDQAMQAFRVAWLSEQQRLTLAQVNGSGRLNWRPKAEGGPVIAVAGLDLAPWTELGLALGFLPETLGRARGTIDQLDLWPAGRDQWRYQGRFTRLAIPAGERTPKIDGLNGRFEGWGGTGRAQLSSEGLLFDYPWLFRAPFPVSHIRTGVRWELGDGEAHVGVDDLLMMSEHGVISGGGDVVVTPDTAPRLNLAFDFENMDPAYAQVYYPIPIMPPGTLDWLDQAAFQGRIAEGSVRLRGDMSEFPFDGEADGEFRVRFQAEGVSFEYSPGWPRLRDVHAAVEFAGAGFRVREGDGYILDTALADISATIPDLLAEPATLQVQGRATGAVEDVEEFLLTGPLQDVAAPEDVADWEFGGDHRTWLELTLPLAATDEFIMVGDTGLYDAMARNEVAGLRFTQMDGPLRFDQDGLESGGLQVDFNGLNAEAEGSLDWRDALAAELRLSGQLITADLEGLADEWPEAAPVVERVSGFAPWAAEWSFEGNPANARTRLEADLVDVALMLPAPLQKPRGAPALLQITAEPTARGIELQARLGDNVQAGAELAGALAERRLLKGYLHFGQSSPTLRQSTGIEIGGQVETLDTAGWAAFADVGAAAADHAPRPVTIGLTADEVLLGPLKLPQTRITGESHGADWTARLDGGAEGTLSFDAEPGRFEAFLEHAVLAAQGNENGEPAGGDEGEPEMLLEGAEDWADFDVQVRELMLNGASLGALTARGRATETGYEVTPFELEGPLINLRGHGNHWTEPGRTELTLGVEGSELGELLALLGYQQAIEEGAFDLAASLHWPGNGEAIGLEHLNGTASLQVEDGRLMEVRPGVGRVFGLLSIQALPRRLRLDFRDVFQEGLAFTALQGDFEFVDGHAFTDNLALEGPLVRLESQGRTGLVARDYDQVVTVYPPVTEGLPLAGVLLSGPVAGAALWLGQDLLRIPIERLTRVQYRVTGPWESPNVEPAGEPAETR